MVFSSILFLWALFPVILVTYYLPLPRSKAEHRLKFQNFMLVVFSLFFYAWGEPKYIFLMLFSVLINFSFGLLIEQKKQKSLLLAFCVAANLLLLGYFKYFNFFVEIWNQLAGSTAQLSVKTVALPIGISFYTFQALSYVVDVYRGENRAQKSFLYMMLYISFFPQLIAGPIVKYHDIERQIEDRRVTLDDFCYGIKRFILGLGKKVILSNTFAEVVDLAFAYHPANLSRRLLWGTAILYMLQIYFDFSGYSDMAIGLGKMFGFSFQENFLLPYTATSIRDFWRKWHVSLSSWFREYVYIPLGGNRKGTVRTYINLIAVFFLTGIWHGAGWTFIIWGFYHGFFNILERCFLGKWMGKGRWNILEHIYTLFVVLIGWVIFRAPTFSYALDYIRYMFVPHECMLQAERFFSTKVTLYMIIGILGSGIVQSLLRQKNFRFAADSRISLAGMAGYMAVMWLSLMLLVNNTYNPFIYFRF
ncbi:MAG: MBOAT family protein [Lachnospiraceae bacterium]|jgi:alginate O-acetyltransferase complex protein AlgI|nr:MBOAT family protein [Lachnospiraceae bacterium]